MGCVVLLWLPGKQAIGAGLLVCTMIGAILAHLLILGPTAVPALVLGIIASVVAYQHSDQISGLLRRAYSLKPFLKELT